MRLGTMRLLAILLLCLPAFGQATYKGGKYSGAGNYVTQGQGGTGENFYCAKGSGIEKTEGTPLWAATDDMATAPTQCIYTGLDATPSPGNVYTPALTATFNNVLLSANGGPAVNADGTTTGSPAQHLACGDTIIISAAVTYVGEYIFPALSCDGAHWITVRTSGTTNALFPGEGVRAAPCIMGLTNDDAHNGGVRQVPGYPDFVCAIPTVLSAKIMQGNLPGGSVSSHSAISFAPLANHYRFIGIEFAKDPAFSISQIVNLPVDGLTMGPNHIIFDRSLIHGDPWTPASTPANESGNGVNAKNSQWIALINSWNYDTYCNASCVDSHNYGAGTGFYQDGPHKLYNNLMATAGESWMFGGGGQGAGTPNPVNEEIRSNHSFKPLTWMVPINSCPNYYQTITKNLGEFKNITYALLEGNVYENSWQGCQSDQTGFAQTFNAVNQNNNQSMHVDVDGTNVVNSSLQCKAGSNAGNSCTNDSQCPSSSCVRLSFTHHTASSPIAGNPVDALYCPPGGCILEDPANNIDYRFCNGANSCDQSGIPNLQCGTTPPQGSVAGTACTTGAQCPASYCAPTITARVTQPVPATTFLNVNSCVPGDSPNAKAQNITFRFNEIYNVTQGMNVATPLSSHCRDQGNGTSGISIHDNVLHGLSREMSNGNDPYSASMAFRISNNALPPGVIKSVGVRHDTVAVETGNQGNISGFGNQVENTGIQYMQGLAITDNVAPASWSITPVTKGINGQPGLANEYAVTSCQRYFTAEIPDGTVQATPVPPPPVWPPQDFTFAGLPGGGTNYLVRFNGQWTAISSQTPTSFHVTATVGVGDTIVVNDLNDCDWTFASNVLGTGTSGETGILEFGAPGLSPNFGGSGQAQDPYPNLISGLPSSYFCGAGGTQSCVLDEIATPGIFTNNFVSWLTGRSGNYAISNTSPYLNTASDALTRPATGRSPGADFTLLAAKTAGVRGLTFLPALTVTTSTLPGGTRGTAYNAQLQASFGASQFWDGYKSWWVETIPAACAGNCGSVNNGAVHSGLVISRSGIVNGPLAILFVSRTGCPGACLSNYTISQTITGGTPEVGQVVSMAQFLNGAGGANANDSSFNGICTITAVSGNVYSCAMTNGVDVNIVSHKPNSPKTCGINNNGFCDSTASFAPISAGTYTFWVGARDGASQVARGPVTLVVGP